MPFLTPRSRPVPLARRSEWPGIDPRCSLASWERGPRFRDRQLGEFVVSLFRAAKRARERAGVRTAFSPFDLHHGHVFLSHGSGNQARAVRRGRLVGPAGEPLGACSAADRGDSASFRRPAPSRRGTLGVLFHAAEYPAYDPVSFPYDLGYCQRGSDVRDASPAALATRSVVWCGRALVLDARALPALFDPLLRPLGTALEEDFGTPIADVYFLPWTRGRRGEEVGQLLGAGADARSVASLRQTLWVFPRI